MRLAIIGSSRLGLQCLRWAIGAPQIEVVGVITLGPEFTISYAPSGVRNVLHADLSALAKQHQIPAIRMRERMTEDGLLASLLSWEPDACLVAGWYHNVPRSWREMVPAYGLHASLLPAFAGGAPLVWALIQGEERTGVTLFQLADGVDTGPIVGQVGFPIGPRDTIAELLKSAEDAAIRLLEEFIPALSAGTIELRAQELENHRSWPQRSPADGIIDWRKSAESLDRWVRAQSRPYPGAFSFLRGVKVTIWRAGWSRTHISSAAPGTVVLAPEGSFAVRCGEGALILTEIELAGRTVQAHELSDVLDLGEVFANY